MDEKLKPYARFLETVAEQLIEYQPKKACLCAILPGGEVLTGYFGDVGCQDKAIMAHNINCDAVLDMVMANARMIVQEAEEQEDEG